MLKSFDDRALAFFEALIITPNGVSELKESFFAGVEESFISTYKCQEDSDVIHVNSRDEYGGLVKSKQIFKDFLKARLIREIKLSKKFINSRASETLSQPSFNNIFFCYIENTLIDLNKKSKSIDYLEINNAVIDIMTFYHASYNKYHNFCKEYLDTLSVYRKTTNNDKTVLSFNWKEGNKNTEIEYLYNSLITSNPPFINSSLETFKKAFTNNKLEEGETIKWLCKNVKNKKIISQNTLVVLLQTLYDKGFIVSDLNDFNKTVENIFSTPNGVKLKNIKVTKKVKSKNPSRIQEIRVILDGLYNIA